MPIDAPAARPPRPLALAADTEAISTDLWPGNSLTIRNDSGSPFLVRCARGGYVPPTAARLGPDDDILFLDVDGVLNHSGPGPDGFYSNRLRPGCCDALARVLKATGCKVVLSSSWRYQILRGQATLLGFAYLLYTHGLTGMTRALIGHTAADPEAADPRDLPDDLRSRQVADWLAEHGPARRYLMVDDEDHGAAAWGHPLLRTDGRVGFTEADADRAIAVLEGRV